MKRTSLVVVAAIAAVGLAACSTGQLQKAADIAQTANTVLTDACNDANATLAKVQTQAKGGALDTVNGIGAYIVNSCSSAE